MSKHTPGPWLAVKYSKKRFGIGRQGDSAFAFLQGIDVDADHPAMRANAALMAAAPELLEALEQAIAFMDGERTPINALVHARSILAKAKGEA